MSKIKTEDRQLKHRIDNILKEQRLFYNTLFISQGVHEYDAQYLLSKLETKISQDDQHNLEEYISPLELEHFVFKFKHSKSRAEDGIPEEWYQHFWYLIKYEFHSLTRNILIQTLSPILNTKVYDHSFTNVANVKI